MGCDIHSMAEVRDPDTGEWHKLEGNLFKYPWTFRHVVPTEEVVDALSDAELLDALDFHVTYKREGEDSYAHEFPLIDNALRALIEAFADRVTRETTRWRDDREGLQRRFGEGDEHDPDAWTRMRRDIIAANAPALTGKQREALRRSILEYRFYATLEELAEDYGYDLGDPEQRETAETLFNDPEENGLTISQERLRSEPVWYHDEPLDSRNYGLFAILAGVRDYGDGTEQIAEVRGVPEDASPEYEALVRRWGVDDGHTHSWVTLADIRVYDLDGDVPTTGVISEPQYEALKAAGWPDDPYADLKHWSGWISGGKIAVFTPEGYEAWVAAERPYVRQPEGASIFSPDIPITPEMIPDPIAAPLAAAPAFHRGPNDTTMEEATAGRVDLWREEYGWDDEQIAKAEASLPSEFDQGRYSYNGVVPYIQVKWLRKRRDVVGQEFSDMTDVFERLVAERRLTPEDVRVVFFFDN